MLLVCCSTSLVSLPDRLGERSDTFFKQDFYLLEFTPHLYAPHLSVTYFKNTSSCSNNHILKHASSLDQNSFSGKINKPKLLI